MTTNSKISNFVENQFPSFIRDDGPNFVAFVKAYYQWMEQANNAIEVSKNLLTYQDIDTTYDKYLEYFHREIIGSIPRSTLADKQKLIKHIKDVYRSRGSELSYQLLFRLLYNEEITFYYPGQDILRASDGRWVQENSIRISAPRTATAAQLENKNIVGLTSGAIARVDKVIQTTSGGILVDELFLLDIIGTFEDGERVALSTDSSVYASVFSISGPLQGVNIISGGAFHQIDDALVYTSASGAGANGAVLEVSGSSAAQWYIANGGSGYTTGASITVNDGPTGTGTSFIISTISDTEDLNINIDRILPMASVIINTGPTFVSLGANTSVGWNLILTVGGVNQAVIQENTPVVENQIYKVAIKYNINDFKMYVNGSQVGADISGSTYAGGTLSRLALDVASGSLPFYGNVKQLIVFPTALSNTELAALTTL